MHKNTNGQTAQIHRKICFHACNLQQQPSMIINYALSRVRFHIHQLRINGSHKSCSQGRERKSEKRERKEESCEGRRVFRMGMSSWSPNDNYNHWVSVPLIPPSVSLSSIMAVSPPSSKLLLLLISSLGWLSTPGSAFVMDRDHMTSSGRSLLF